MFVGCKGTIHRDAAIKNRARILLLFPPLKISLGAAPCCIFNNIFSRNAFIAKSLHSSQRNFNMVYQTAAEDNYRDAIILDRLNKHRRIFGPGNRARSPMFHAHVVSGKDITVPLPTWYDGKTWFEEHFDLILQDHSVRVIREAKRNAKPPCSCSCKIRLASKTSWVI
jgi:hypothetical protein